jgi:hypothetical protein
MPRLEFEPTTPLFGRAKRIQSSDRAAGHCNRRRGGRWLKLINKLWFEETTNFRGEGGLNIRRAIIESNVLCASDVQVCPAAGARCAAQMARDSSQACRVIQLNSSLSFLLQIFTATGRRPWQPPTPRLSVTRAHRPTHSEPCTS